MSSSSLGWTDFNNFSWSPAFWSLLPGVVVLPALAAAVLLLVPPAPTRVDLNNFGASPPPNVTCASAVSVLCCLVLLVSFCCWDFVDLVGSLPAAAAGAGAASVVSGGGGGVGLGVEDGAGRAKFVGLNLGYGLVGGDELLG